MADSKSGKLLVIGTGNELADMGKQVMVGATIVQANAVQPGTEMARKEAPATIAIFPLGPGSAAIDTTRRLHRKAG